MNRWQKSELKRKYEITFASLLALFGGGMMISAFHATTTSACISLFGGIIVGASSLGWVIILDMMENPRVYDCVKGGIIYNDEVRARLDKRIEKFRRENLD